MLGRMAPDVARITPAQLWARMAQGEEPTFIDSRNPKAWGSSPSKLPGAIRVAADAAEDHLPATRLHEPIVTYCT